MKQKEEENLFVFKSLLFDKIIKKKSTANTLTFTSQKADRSDRSPEIQPLLAKKCVQIEISAHYSAITLYTTHALVWINMRREGYYQLGGPKRKLWEKNFSP